MGWCLPCSLNEENQGRFHFECQEARMPFVDLRKYNTKVPVQLTQWVTSTSRYCRQCRCYSGVQEHPLQAPIQNSTFSFNGNSGMKVLYVLRVSSYPPKRAWKVKCLWPSLSSTPHTAVTVGVSEKQWQMPALRINKHNLWEVQLL